jgi:hypothetical protein
VLRFLAKAQVLRIRQASSGTFEISMDRGGAGALSPAANRVLATVALMSNFEVTAMEPVVIVRARGAGW